MELAKVFNFSNKQLRTAGTASEPWFCGKDVAEILCYTNTMKAIRDHVDIDDKMTFESLLDTRTIRSPSNSTIAKKTLTAIYINESGLYSLIIRSKLESAKAFKKWITSEVLPSIRKNGYYVSKDISSEKITQLEHELNTTKLALEKSDKRITKLNRFVKVAQDLKKEEGFYIATSKLYSQNNLFKYGGVASMKELYGRLNTYNTGRPESDLYFYAKIYKCHSYRHIESTLAMLAKYFKDKIDGRKEMIHMRYDCLIELIDFIMENHDKDIKFINENSKRFLQSTIEDDALTPTTLAIENFTDIKITKRVKKEDVSDWDNEKIIATLKTLINQYAENKLGCPYDFDTDKNSKQLKFAWAEFNKTLNTFKGKTKTEWRKQFEKIIKDAEMVVCYWRNR